MQFVDVKTDIAFKIEGKTDVAHKLKALGLGLTSSYKPPA